MNSICNFLEKVVYTYIKFNVSDKKFKGHRDFKIQLQIVDFKLEKKASERSVRNTGDNRFTITKVSNQNSKSHVLSKYAQCEQFITDI